MTEVRDRTTRASRAARSARAAESGMTAKLADRAHVFGSRSVAHAQPSTDRTMVGRRRGEHLARHDLHAVAHEHVIDLTVRSRRGIGTAAHRAPPMRKHRDNTGTPKIAVAR